MAYTYTKPQPMVNIATLMSLSGFYAEGDAAVAANIAFRNKKTIEFTDPNNNTTYLIPYHAIQAFVFGYGEPTSETKEDPYCKEGNGGEKVVIIRSTGRTDSIFAEDSSVKTAKEFWDAVEENPNIPVRWDDGSEQFDYAPFRNDSTTKSFNNGNYFVAAYHNDEGEEYTTVSWYDNGD